MRKELRGKAEALGVPILSEEHDVSSMTTYIAKLGVKIHKGYFKSCKEKEDMKDIVEEVPVPNRKRRLRSAISQSEKMDIIHSVLVQHKKANMVAKEFWVAYSTVKDLISKAKKKPSFVAEIFSKPNI